MKFHNIVLPNGIVFAHKPRHTNWFSPNTFDANFKEAPKSPGVYCIKRFDLLAKKTTVVYVGSSVNLDSRYRGHETLKKCREEEESPFIAYGFYFREIPVGHYQYEVSLIKRLKPALNKHHKSARN